MKFNKDETKIFIEYYKYFIKLRNILSNYHKTDIKNIKLESIKEKPSNCKYQLVVKIIFIRFVINDLLSIDINVNIGIITCVSISNFKTNYWRYNLNKNNYNNIVIEYNKNKYNKNKYNKNKYYVDIISKNIILKPLYNYQWFLDTITMKYYYSLKKYKIYIIYIKNINDVYNDWSDTCLFYNEYSYISKLFI